MTPQASYFRVWGTRKCDELRTYVFSINFSPWRIIDDSGGAFTMGLIGGSLFNVINGARHAPSGFSRRTLGGLARMKERAPVLGGQVSYKTVFFFIDGGLNKLWPIL